MFDQTLFPTWEFKGKSGNFPGTNVHKIFVKRIYKFFFVYIIYSRGYKKRAISGKFCNTLYVRQSHFKLNFFLFKVNYCTTRYVL